MYFLSRSMKVRDSGILAWVWGQGKTSQVLGTFRLLDFTMLQPFLTWRTFLNLWTIYFFNFPFFFPGRGKPHTLNQWIGRHNCIVSHCINRIIGNVTLIFYGFEICHKLNSHLIWFDFIHVVYSTRLLYSPMIAHVKSWNMQLNFISNKYTSCAQLLLLLLMYQCTAGWVTQR
jgi:hypothetical protein